MSELSAQEKEAKIAEIVDQHMRESGRRVRRNHGLEVQRAVAGAYERVAMAMDDHAVKKVYETARPLAYAAAAGIRLRAGVADYGIGLLLMTGGLNRLSEGGYIGGVGRMIAGGAMMNVRPVAELARLGATAWGHGAERVAHVVNGILGKSPEPVPKPAAA